MKRRFLIPVVGILILLGPSQAWADSQVYVSFSVGGAVVIGAGVVYWGVSSGSQVSRFTPSPENPEGLSRTEIMPFKKTSHAIRILPQILPSVTSVGERPIPDLISDRHDPGTAAMLEMPLFVFRW